jgi:type VI secretion system protein ImpB
MDGKTGAEALIARLLEEPALMQALSAQPRPEAQPTETQTPTEGA